MRVRSAFTLIEVLIIIAVLGITSAISLNAGVESQQRAVFQSNLQEIILIFQEQRSAALANETPENLGYGVQVLSLPDQQLITKFIDLNGDGQLTPGPEAQEVLDLGQRNNLSLAGRYYLYTDYAGKFDRVPRDTSTVTVVFNSNNFTCQLAGENDGPVEKATFIELLIGREGDDFNSIKADNLSQFLGVNHIGCTPELSQESIIEE